MLLLGAVLVPAASAQADDHGMQLFPAGDPPRVELQEVFYDRVALPYSDVVAPPRGRRNLELRYRAIGSPTPDSLLYAFRMEGLEEEWAEVGTRTIAYYRGLEPGNYVFQVRAKRVTGEWGPAAEASVSIDPYLYEEPWVLVLGFLSLLIGVTGAVGWRTRRAADREARLSRLVDERTSALRDAKQRAEEALAQAEREEAKAKEALELVEEQSIQLLRMDHMKNRLFANISHEFRTPLTLILDPLEQALNGGYGLPGEDASRALGLARDNAHRLLHLINQILDLAKMEAGSMDLHARKHDLVPLLRNATETFASEATRRGIILRFHSDLPTLEAYVDAEKIEKGIHNLLMNALKATGKGGKVGLSVAVVEQGTHAQITVRDTGEGIPEDEQPYIFDRFYQAETGRTSGGTGIGLALVRETVDLHRGRVGVESVPGYGSAFRIWLPLGRAHLEDHEIRVGSTESSPLDVASIVADRPPDAVSEVLPEASSDRRPQVLVVEDNPALRQLVVGHLRNAYRTIEAEDGVAALRVARERRPDLIISDVLMPGVDGLALCRRIKADPQLSDTPVILLTARASDADRLEALQTGADDFLTKPFSALELLTRAENLIRSRQTLRERYSQEVVLPVSGRALPSADAVFIERVYAVVDAHLGDEGFTVVQLASELGVSESSLKRRVRSLAGVPPVELIRDRRLEHAAARLLAKVGTVGEVAAQVGFGSPSYFAKCFRERYGVSPSAFADAASTDSESIEPDSEASSSAGEE